MIQCKKLILFPILFIIPTMSFTAPFIDNVYNSKFEKGYPVDEDQMIGAYNAQGRINTCGNWDFFAGGSLLLWQPKEQGLDFALISPINPSSKRAHDFYPKFEYDPGLKLNLGLFFSEDNWGIWTQYTRFSDKLCFKKFINTSNETVINYWRIGDPIDKIASLFSSWDLDFNIFDLSLERPYYIGTKLIFDPYIGIKSGWIDQKVKVAYSTSSSDYETEVFSDSWLLGPAMGINTNWLMAEGFRFFGNGSIALFFQKFKLSAKEFQRKNSYSIDDADEINCFNANLNLSLGFGWGRYFFQQKIHFDAMAGYELQLFWNQNQMKSFVEEIKNKIYSNPGNLTPHGFIFALRLDF